ncbi:hypothetical protein IC229_25095 [Spirosoma sp. BT702]|uniref:Uncharacterized protein n=1 Tax=Spirosoma profusum TaxID=2771354 RepID=A0A927ASJ2_9BACT|nr:hypothetical protein [Spirosoma profusum]MBD2703946.1 hypothetical protein [Spirosoma profusum]
MKQILYVSTATILQLFATFTYAQSVSLSKSIYPPGEQIFVNYSGFPGNNRDWISIAQPGSADDKYIVWAYTNGNRSGTMNFNGLSYGNYEIRGYYNNEGTVRVRVPFRVGNADQNLSVKTQRPSYRPGEKILVDFSGLPGNARDWISIAQPGSADDKYIVWKYADGKQSGTMELAGQPEGNYEIRSYFNNDGVIRSRHAFTVSKNATGTTPTTGRTGRPGRFCNKELSVFYSGVNQLGLAWGRLGSDVIAPGTITDVQAALSSAIAGINTITCLDFDVNKIRSYSTRLPGMSRVQAVNEIDQLIKEILASIQRARITCNSGASLADLYGIGIHLGASQAICNTFVCRAIPADWQGNLRNHLSMVSRGISGYSACIPGVSPSVTSGVAVGSPNAYIPFSSIVAIHIQVLWSVSLSSCCCSCN